MRWAWAAGPNRGAPARRCRRCETVHSLVAAAATPAAAAAGAAASHVSIRLLPREEKEGRLKIEGINNAELLQRGTSCDHVG